MASKVHRVRFYKPTPQPINCISFNKKLKRIALARQDSSIEVWDIRHAACLVSVITGNNNSVEALGWVGQDRLLSTGLNGSLIEWDLAKLKQKKSVLLTGYAAWCLDVNADETLVAVGTEQGYVNLFSVEDDDIIYNKLFDKQDGRIMCCKFDKTGSTLVTGSMDTIRVWSVQTGHAITRMTVARNRKEVLIWSVAVLSDNTIVSGDSFGRLTFWDAAVGEQIESFVTHKADILSIVVSEDERELYCSGIDPIITHFKKINKSQWVKNVQRHIHDHDVRGLLLSDGKLLSVGIDGYITFSSHPPKWVMRIPPLLPTPSSYVSPKKKLLLLRYSKHLEVWKLGSYDSTDNGAVVTDLETVEKSNIIENGNKIEEDSSVKEVTKLAKYIEKKGLQIVDQPVKLVSIQTKHKKQLQCCAMSPSGEFIVYSTNSEVRMLKLGMDDQEENNISLSKVLINGLSETCDRIAFTEDSRTMVVHSGGTLYILLVDPEAGATVIQTITGEKTLNIKSALHLVVSSQTSSGATYIVVADDRGHIDVLVNSKKKYSLYVRLPKYQCVPTAITVDHVNEMLIVVYADQTICEYDLRRKSMRESWQTAPPPRAWWQRTVSADAVSAHPRRHALVCHDHSSLWVLDRNTQVEDSEPVFKKKPDNPTPCAFKVIPAKYLSGFHWLGEDEAVMVEVLPDNIVSQLPAPAQLNKWG